MTLANERLLAIRNARAFLEALLDPKKTPKIPRKYRVEARWVLKHFPPEFYLNLIDQNCKCEVFSDKYINQPKRKEYKMPKAKKQPAKKPAKKGKK